MANIKKERDQFLAIKKTYNQANISGILSVWILYQNKAIWSDKYNKSSKVHSYEAEDHSKIKYKQKFINKTKSGHFFGRFSSFYTNNDQRSIDELVLRLKLVLDIS